MNRYKFKLIEYVQREVIIDAHNVQEAFEKLDDEVISYEREVYRELNDIELISVDAIDLGEE